MCLRSKSNTRITTTLTRTPTSHRVLTTTTSSTLSRKVRRKKWHRVWPAGISPMLTHGASVRRTRRGGSGARKESLAKRNQHRLIFIFRWNVALRKWTGRSLAVDSRRDRDLVPSSKPTRSIVSRSTRGTNVPPSTSKIHFWRHIQVAWTCLKNSSHLAGRNRPNRKS